MKKIVMMAALGFALGLAVSTVPSEALAKRAAQQTADSGGFTIEQRLNRNTRKCQRGDQIACKKVIKLQSRK